MRRRAALVAIAAVAAAGLIPAHALADPPEPPVDTVTNYLCVWDNANRWGGVCVPGMHEVIVKIDDLLDGLSDSGHTFSL